MFYTPKKKKKKLSSDACLKELGFKVKGALKPIT